MRRRRPGSSPRWRGVPGSNPFFVAELGRAGLDAAPVPAGVRELVARRVARLPGDCRALLDAAAVLGREIDIALFAAVSGQGADAVLDALRPAIEERVLERPPGRAGLRFIHDVVREALLTGLAPGSGRGSTRVS